MGNTPFHILLIFLIPVLKVLCCYLPPKGSGSSCGKLQKYLMPRDQWSAKEPSGFIDCMRSPVRYVIIHHTVSGACSTTKSCSEEMQKLQKDHMEKKKWPDVGYHYVIGGDARVYEGRPCSKMGGHTKNHNRMSIGIAFFGDYQKQPPDTKMMDLVPKIAHCAVEKGYLHPNFVVIGHRDAFCSTCPGDALYKVIKKWTKFSGTVPVHSYTCDAPQTTTATTEAKPTTTTASPTTTAKPTTTVAPKEDQSHKVGIPVYVYVLLSEKH